MNLRTSCLVASSVVVAAAVAFAQQPPWKISVTGRSSAIAVPGTMDGAIVAPSARQGFVQAPDGTGSLSFGIETTGDRTAVTLGLAGTMSLDVLFAVPPGVDVVELRWPGRAPIPLTETGKAVVR